MAVALSGCQSGDTAGATGDSRSAALSTMERIAIAAQSCWFASDDAAFAPYRMANELNSFSGRPRILLVPQEAPESRPLLVVQAQGTPARVEAFGPLMQQEDGPRIANDIRRWADGASACT